jgi:hypothetical protein
VWVSVAILGELLQERRQERVVVNGRRGGLEQSKPEKLLNSLSVFLGNTCDTAHQCAANAIHQIIAQLVSVIGTRGVLRATDRA